MSKSLYLSENGCFPKAVTVWGYIQNHNHVFKPVGKTERGAKTMATKREILEGDWNSVAVGYISPINNMFVATAKRDICINGFKWFEVE